MTFSGNSFLSLSADKSTIKSHLCNYQLYYNSQQFYFSTNKNQQSINFPRRTRRITLLELKKENLLLILDNWVGIEAARTGAGWT